MMDNDERVPVAVRWKHRHVWIDRGPSKLSAEA